MITEKEHHKHAKIAKPTFGSYSRNELALMGTTCEQVRELSEAIIQSLGAKYRIAYLDTDHQSFDHDLAPEMLRMGARFEWSDRRNHHQISLRESMNRHDMHLQFGSMDLVLVNGNHHVASAQLLVVNPKKESSLEKRADRLTNVQCVFGRKADLPHFVAERKLVDTSVKELPGAEIPELIKWLDNWLQPRTAPLKGMVLAGGKSLRMGIDKGSIAYSGKDQRNHTADLLAPFCEEVYISCRRKQLDEIQSSYPLLADSYLGLGPYGAILSAFQKDPNAAWLVVACDLPLLDAGAIQQLIEGRNSSKWATAYQNPETEFPDPLCTIWEPRSYKRLLEFLSLGYSCPRKVLINSDCEILNTERPEVLTNVNTPEEMDRIRKVLQPGEL